MEVIEPINQLLKTPIINKEGLERLIEERKEINFYSWECPARGEIFINESNEVDCYFTEDFDRDYQEMRFLKRKDTMSKVIDWIRGLGIREYTLYFAGTNAGIIYPRSEEEVLEIQRFFDEFCEYAEDKIRKEYDFNIKVINFFNIYREYRDMYDKAYNYVMDSFGFDGKSEYPYFKLVKKGRKRFRDFLTPLKKHVGAYNIDLNILIRYAMKVIASYNAEAWVMRNTVSNPVWINNEGGYSKPRMVGAYIKYMKKEGIPIITV